MRFISAVFTFYLLSLPCSLIAQPIEKIKTIKLKHKNDVVIMENGDRNTGEIKKMEFGILYLKSDRVADTLKLDWESIVRVHSIAQYEFQTKDKEFYVGVIPADLNDDEISDATLRILLNNGGQIDLPITDIISIREIGRSFLSRMNIFVDAGAGYTSANSRAQSNLNFSATLAEPKYSGTLDISSQFSREPGAEQTLRNELQTTAQRVITKRWESILLIALLSDKQLDLDLRTTAGGGVLRSLLETNRTIFAIIGGLVYTSENYSIDAGRNNAEALIGLTLSTYRFRGSSLSTRVHVFPSVSDPGRVRIDTDFDWMWDMALDFYWRIGLTNNYDNRPPPEGINNNLSITTSFGWSF